MTNNQEMHVTLDLYAASVPVFISSMQNLMVWTEKALAAGLAEPTILAARMAPDMLPFPGQIQRASDTAKNAVARLTGQAAPSMPDTEATTAELADRCRRTIDFLQSVDPAAFDGAGQREIVLPFRSFGTLRMTGAEYLTGYAVPNFFFHVTTAYGLLRAAGAPLGKADFLRHLSVHADEAPAAP